MNPTYDTNHTVVLLLIVAAYLAPLIIAKARGYHQTGAIAVVNILTGWTLLGYVVALAWACSAKRP